MRALTVIFAILIASPAVAGSAQGQRFLANCIDYGTYIGGVAKHHAAAERRSLTTAQVDFLLENHPQIIKALTLPHGMTVPVVFGHWWSQPGYETALITLAGPARGSPERFCIRAEGELPLEKMQFYFEPET